MQDRILPWALDGADLGSDVLEIGPGYGVTTRVLAARVEHLTALEVDPGLAAGLATRVANAPVRVVHGDGTAMPFGDGEFSGAACFTMLHHVPSPHLQDRLFAEVRRVLRPGGVFAGCDSRAGVRFRMIHLFDTMTLVDPATLAARLEGAGFTGVEVGTGPAAVRFRARTPA